MTNKLIKIGISSCFFYPDILRNSFGPKTLCYLENDMAKYLYQENVLPILIPNFSGKKLDDLLLNLDALVLQGGSDLSPESYDEPYLDQIKWPGDLIRDQYELSLVQHFVKLKKPILGICRGAQILNTYFGGTLYQDIPSQHQTKTIHRDAIEYDNVCHQITICSGGILDSIYNTNKKDLIVNSVHHQCIKQLGDQLKVEAISTSDQIIEAFSYKNFVLGVQWHPEFSDTLKEKVLDSSLLIKKFLEMITK